jgi:3-hydroxyanthranilate 3,4-dioxygenase
LYEEFFQLVDIEQDFPKVFEHFYRSTEHRTCGVCGLLNPRPAHFEDAARQDPT